ncbi:MAG: GNAT family N-acetyltransferase [Candidatus Sulfotelmatobacter sp.]|jgi:ribosomal-protein-alanine N-acetyltransferase
MIDLERQSPAAGHWSRNQYQTLFAAPDRKTEVQKTEVQKSEFQKSEDQKSERFAWVAEAWVAEDEEAALPERLAPTSPEILAFLIAHRVDAAWELENIVVAATARRRGIAQRLLGELIEQVRSTQGSEISLEVRQSNHEARSLYRKAGFEEVGLRKGYYSNPPEDAILCRLRF